MVSVRAEITDVLYRAPHCYTSVSNFHYHLAYVETQPGTHPWGREQRKLCWPQTKSNGGRWGMKRGMENGEHCVCVCVCVHLCVCVFLSVCVSEQRAMRPSILRGLKCGCKTLMIPCLLTKPPRYCLLLIHFSHITHTLSCIMCSRSVKEKII